MPRPDVGIITAQAYDELPEFYRTADEALDFPLLRYLSTLLDQLTPIDELVHRFTFLPPEDNLDDLETVGTLSRPAPPQHYGSGTYGEADYGDADTVDLVDPVSAESGWLPWLAQLVGVAKPDATAEELRARIINREKIWAHGTPDAITAAAAGALTGSRFVQLIPHYQGDPFTIAVVTLREETPASDTWGTLKAIAPRWRDLQALGSFAAAAAPGVAAAADEERPAGFRLAHVYIDEVT